MSTWYVNIPLSFYDAQLNEYALLEKIRAQVGGCQGTVTSRPDNHGHSHCLSIKLEICGELSEPVDDMVSQCLFGMAYDKVEQWRRDLRRNGLPFSLIDFIFPVV